MDMNVEVVKLEIAKRLAAYPLYSQEKTASVQQHMVSAKLYSAFGSGTWYITEYRPETGIAFGYVMGLDYDEWGYISIDELLEVRHPTGLPAIRLDHGFVPRVFYEVLAAHQPHRAIEVIVLMASE